mmetsp:Transcript_60093/g.131669  ORF Transcript_60093/g.131669 Transcript_60093/m.131669 type:complete len:494 (+) Transcript_60093:56-1537(+)
MVEASRGEGTSSEEATRYRNGVVKLSLAFLALFAGYFAAQGLQSSLNGVLGFINLGVLYTTFAFVCLLAPALLQGMEAKNVPIMPLLFLSGVAYLLMVVGCAFPIPAVGESGRTALIVVNLLLSFFVGAAAPILWTIQNTYVGRCAASACSDSTDSQALSRTTSSFNGMFFTFFQFAGAVGTGISSLVFAFDKGGSNRTFLFVLLGAISFVGNVAFLFLPKMPKPLDGLRARQGDCSREVAALGEQPLPPCNSTLKLPFSEARMGLFVPLIFVNGAVLAFVNADYPKTFVTEVLGPRLTGPSLLVFYLVNSASSGMWGFLIHRGFLRTSTVFFLSFLIQLAVIIFLMLSKAGSIPCFKQHFVFHDEKSADVNSQWRVNSNGEPHAWEYLAPLICVALIAVGDSVYESQPPAVLQAFFQDEKMVAAMANYKMWQSFGFAAEFVVGAAVASVQARLATLLAVFVLAYVCLVFLDKKVASISAAEDNDTISDSHGE